jgi:hypothetical protein
LFSKYVFILFFTSIREFYLLLFFKDCIQTYNFFIFSIKNVSNKKKQNKIVNTHKRSYIMNKKTKLLSTDANTEIKNTEIKVKDFDTLNVEEWVEKNLSSSRLQTHI